MRSPQPDNHATATVETGRILVVDDNEANRDMLSRRLSRRGYSIEVAENGRQALEMLYASPFDLVLLDIMMPELNGYEVLDRLRSDEAFRHVPVLMISAVDEMDSVIRCVELGADDYLPKPFNPTLLLARVQASLAKKRLHDNEQRYARGLERELEIGRRIQQGFLPSNLPQLAGWDIAARFLPASQVAGDFYDVFGLPTGRIGFVIADVCGKGVGAALFMALFRSLIRAFAERASTAKAGGSSDDAVLTEAISATNTYITRVHKSAHTFASVFFGLLNPGTGGVRYINAGHLPPVVTNGGVIEARLMPTGPAVGLTPHASFELGQVNLSSGACLLAFTDGVTEARNGDRDFFSEDRLLPLLEPTPPTASSLLDVIERAVHEYARGALPSDDLTLLALRRIAH